MLFLRGFLLLLLCVCVCESVGMGGSIVFMLLFFAWGCSCWNSVVYTVYYESESTAAKDNFNVKRLQKLSYLHLLTGCFMKISLQTSEQKALN